MSGHVRIKICGVTRLEDARVVAELGVDAVGVVLWAGSPRAVTLALARAVCRELPPFTSRVGVFVSPSLADVEAAVEQVGLGAIQLHAVADPAPFLRFGLPVLWAAGLAEAEPDPVPPPHTTLLLDAHDQARHGGTGRTIDWGRAERLARRLRLVLAGGLTADNVAHAIEVVRPYAVDVSSGVERSPGVKSASRIRAFVEAVRGAAPITVSHT